MHAPIEAIGGIACGFFSAYSAYDFGFHDQITKVRPMIRNRMNSQIADWSRFFISFLSAFGRGSL